MRTPFDHPLGIGLVGVTLAQLVPFFIGLRGLVWGASHRGLLMSGVAVSGLLFAGSVFVMVFGSLMAMQY